MPPRGLTFIYIVYGELDRLYLEMRYSLSTLLYWPSPAPVDVVVYTDKHHLTGSALLLPDHLRNFVKFTGLSPHRAIQAVTFNPAWRIPASIIKNEINPKLKKDPSYLTKNDMAYGPGGLQQNPGPKNALGRCHSRPA